MVLSKSFIQQLLVFFGEPIYRFRQMRVCLGFLQQFSNLFKWRICKTCASSLYLRIRSSFNANYLPKIRMAPVAER